MKKWYCIIKGQGDSGWIPLIKYHIEAEDKKEARSKIESEFVKELPMRFKKENVKPDSLLLQIYEHKGSEYFTHDFFEDKECSVCGIEYNSVEKYNLEGKFGYDDFCSKSCYNTTIEKRDSYIDNFFIPLYITIYKITQISTGKSYIGKSKRSFTLRWWEHIKSKEYIESNIEDFTFQVIKTLDKNTSDEEVLKEESRLIEKYDCINNGFNTVISNNSYANVEFEI